MCIELGQCANEFQYFYQKKKTNDSKLAVAVRFAILIIHLYTEFASHLFLITLLSIKRIKYIKKI